MGKVTPANVNDRKAGCEGIPDDLDVVYADSAYRGPRFRSAVEGCGGPVTNSSNDEKLNRNREISNLRSGIITS